MDKRDFRIITIVCIFLGFFTALAVQSSGPSTQLESLGSVRTFDKLLDDRDLEEEIRAELLQELKNREMHISKFEEQAIRFESGGENIEKQLAELRMMSGLIDMEGPGVVVILNDRKKDESTHSNPGLIDQFIVHDSDLLNVVNELKAAGAEAISINDIRIIETSRISCGGPTINVGKEQRFAPPFKIEAIGDPEELANCFKREDSIYHILDAWGLEFTIKKSDNVYIPRYIYGALDYKYANIVKGDG